MSKQNIYLILALLGIVLPYTIFLPWLLEHGIDFSLFISEFSVNDLAQTAGLDILVTTVALLIFITFESRKIGMINLYIPILATLVGIAFGLAIFLFMRERHYARESD
jgi:hypothetical protein